MWITLVGCAPDHIERIRQLGAKDPIACVRNPEIISGPLARSGYVYRDIWSCHDVSGRYFICLPESYCVDVQDALAPWQRLPPW